MNAAVTFCVRGFLTPDSYRRDRTKDWELQRRGFVVLRFLAEDVIPQ